MTDYEQLALTGGRNHDRTTNAGMYWHRQRSDIDCYGTSMHAIRYDYSRPDVAPFRTANIWKNSQATLHSVSSTACPVKLVYLNGRNLKRAEMSDGGLTGVG